MATTLRNVRPLTWSTKPRYPWTLWANGQQHTIKQGVDFTNAPGSMRMTLQTTAGRKGYRLKSAVRGDEITFMFIPKTDEQVAA